MLRRRVHNLTIGIISLFSLLGAQSRDAVVQIIYPSTNEVVLNDTLDVVFNVAGFFTLGEPGCTDCDGYINVYLNSAFEDSVTSGNTFEITGLGDDTYFLELEAVDPSGASFDPVAGDTVTFHVNWEENFCPPTDLSVSSTNTYESLSLTWREPTSGYSSEYFEDFEGGDGSFIGTADWAYGSPTSGEPSDANSGDFLWGINLGGDYPTNSNSTLDSPPISLSGYTEPQLRFWHWYNTEFSWDGGNVKLSMDGGTTWEIIFPISGYDDDAASTANAGIPGEPCFSGHDQAIWEESIFDLSAYIGEEVILRWHFGSDGSVQYPGWFIDDVTVGEPTLDLFSREFIESCGNLTGYEIYRGGSWLADVDTNFYLDDAVILGTEYCYYVSAVYDSLGTVVLSDTSNNVCGVPEAYSPLPPTYLTAVPGDEEVSLLWAEPGLVIPEGENCLVPFDGGDVGDGFSQTFTGSTVGFENDLQNGFSAASPDVVYQFNVTEVVNVTFSLCDGGTMYDSYLILFEGDCETIIASNDDFCGLQSELSGTLVPGIYNLAVDGFSSSSSGDYSLVVTATTAARVNAFNENISDENKLSDRELEAQKASLIGIDQTRDITGSEILALNYYIPEMTQTLDFNLSVLSPDNEWADGFNLTFPGGWTITSGAIGGDIVPVVVSGNVITFGDPYAVSGGGPLLPGDYGFSVSVTSPVAAGDITLDYYIGGDGWGLDPHSITGTLILNELVWENYDLLGYNVYVDGVLDNLAPVLDFNYLVTGLTNTTLYEFGVASVYYPSYESVPVTISATPTWLFGDISGVVLDPNGDPLDSAIVSAGGVVDTTGVDGAYFLSSLFPGTYMVKAQRQGFDFSEAEVIVIAQENAILHDFLLIPKVGKPGGVLAIGNDHSIDLSWRMPGGGEETILQYSTGILGNAFYFYATYEEGFAHGIRFDVGTDFDVVAASIKILSEGDEFWPWPNDTHGPVRVMIFDDAGGAPGALLHDEEAVAQDGWATIYPEVMGLTGSFYVVASHTLNWQTGGDAEGFGVDENLDYPDNMVTLQDGAWFSGDALGYGGDYMFASVVNVYGARQTVTLSNSLPEYRVTDANLVQSVHDGSFVTMNTLESNPNFITDSRQDSLVGFNVYQALLSGDTLVASTIGADTTTNIIVPTNYVEYCYNVKAIWTTDSYGTLESKQSQNACTIPFKSGDANSDDVVNITDIVMVVDFILGVTIPSESQLRNVDMNHDGSINIVDLVMIIDIISNGTARFMAFDPDALASLELQISDESSLNLNLVYDGTVRGLQFTIDYDATQMKISNPQLVLMRDNVILITNEKEAGKLNVMVANIGGGALDVSSQSLLNIPFEFIGGNGELAEIGLMNSVLAGPTGELIPVSEKSTSLDIEVLPGKFALHQNFPNPFNPTTEIKFDLADVSNVRLTIYNLMGQEIRTLATNEMVAGFHSIVWNGLNDNGSPVASGMYFYMLDAGSFHAMKKMVLLK